MLDPKKIVEPERLYIVRDITEKNVSIDFKVNPNMLSIEEYTTVLEKWTGFFAQIQKAHPNINIHAEIDFR